MPGDAIDSDDLILRDRLALDRTQLANERTLLAYLRTALMLMVTGATAVKFVRETAAVVVTGWALVALGGAVALFGTCRFLSIRRAINRRMKRDESETVPRL